MKATLAALFLLCANLVHCLDITEGEVLAALDAWGKGLVSISTAYANKEDYVTVATNFINKAYNYENSIVLFKPTVAAEEPFRTTFQGALSYFVGGNEFYPEDKGFALKPWKKVSFEIVGIVFTDNRAIVQTKTTLTLQDDSTVLTYFSMGFTRPAGSPDLKIDLHHSSLPPQNGQDITEADVLEALDNWGKGLVSIATAYAENEDYVAVAIDAIRAAYNYENGIVLFKPTVAAEIPFRTTFSGALSYFVGGNEAYPEDTGFALKPWTKVSFEIVGIVHSANRATAQTKTTLTLKDGSTVLTYFSMSFTRPAESSRLKIDLHHSSLPPTVAKPITEADVLAALDAWGKGLVSISTAYANRANGSDYVAVATDFINKAYNYENSIVLFKPTVAAEIPFRTTFSGALSYFVGGNEAYPEDTGFALKPWTKVSFEIVGVVFSTNRAVVQTKTRLTLEDGSSVLTYFSMSFTRPAGSPDLKIDLHHSSLPPAVSTSSSGSSVESSSTQASTDDDGDADVELEVSIVAIVLAAVGIVVAFIALGVLLCAKPANPTIITQAAAQRSVTAV
jgi:hypothetical protein